MNNEPVSQYKAITNTKIEPTVVSYTHPVKELTDEEIWGLHQEHIDELKAVYGKAYAALSKDKVAVEKIASAKDLQKGTLMALQS